MLIIGVNMMHIWYCDHDKKFINVCILAPKGTHDATHLKISPFYKKSMEKTILQEPRMLIEGRDLKPYNIGDSAYP